MKKGSQKKNRDLKGTKFYIEGKRSQ